MASPHATSPTNQSTAAGTTARGHASHSQSIIPQATVSGEAITEPLTESSSDPVIPLDRASATDLGNFVNIQPSKRSISSVATAGSDCQVGSAPLLSLTPTPPQLLSTTPQYSHRQTSPADRTTPPHQIHLASAFAQDSPVTITARRTRRPTTTDNGSPVGIRGEQKNNGRAIGAPGSPHWHFNVLLRHGSNSEDDGAPGPSDRPAPARFVAGPRHSSPQLRRVCGSTSLRTLNNEQEEDQPIPERHEAEDVRAEEPVVGAQEPEEEIPAVEANGLFNPVPEPEFLDEEDFVQVYDPAIDDFEEDEDDDVNDVLLTDDNDETPEGILFAGARGLLRQVGAEVDILDQLEEAALVRGSGAAIRARAALLFLEEELTSSVRSAIQAIETHRDENRRLANIARALRAEGLVARERAAVNAALLEGARSQLAALRQQTRRNV